MYSLSCMGEGSRTGTTADGKRKNRSDGVAAPVPLLSINNTEYLILSTWYVKL